MFKKISQRLRVRVIVLTGVVCVFAVSAPIVRAQQQPQGEETKTEEVSSVSAPPGDPKAAKTTESIDIPVDELKVLIKPFTLAELQNEAAGWMAILQAKAKEISQAEVTVKRQNEGIAKEEEGAKALGDAKKALEEAEETQKGAAPGSPEYQEAAKKIEEAKEDLKKAQEAVDEAQKTKKELKEDETVGDALEKAQRTGDIDKARETLDQAKQDREKITAGSLQYEQATKKIDKLEAAIKTFDDALEEKRVAKPNSPELQQSLQKLDNAHKDLQNVLQEFGVSTSKEQQQSSKALEEKTQAALDNTTITTNGNEKKVAGSPGVVNQQQNLEQKQQQIEQTQEQLEKSAEVEADTKNQLVVAVTRLQEQQTAIIDRFNVILDELKNKGGDDEFYRKYIQAVSSVELDAKDTEGLGLRLLGWAKSEEGGLRWANNTGTFLGVFITSVIAAQVLGMLLNLALSRFGGVSILMRQFIVMLVKRGGILLGFLLALTALEVSLGPVIALLGGVSFVLAFALQSNLGNLASGLMIMGYKPFDVGDEVRVNDLWGYIHTISLANTQIKGFDHQIYTVPNNTIWTSTIENLTTQGVRRGKVPVHVAFDTDLRKVKEILLDVGNSHPSVLKDRSMSAYIYKGKDYCVSTGLKFWANTDDFWTVYEDLTFMIQERFAKEGISIAIPQQDVRIHYASNGQMPKLVSHIPEHYEPRVRNGEAPDEAAEEAEMEAESAY
jgi:small conductance mechanosensitive channel